MSATPKRLDLQAIPFPIIAWIGPGKEQITPKTMADLAAGGFDVSLSELTPGQELKQLDLAAAAGIKLIVMAPPLHFSKPGDASTPAWQKRVRALVRLVGKHPGLFGYYVADEPRKDRIDNVIAAMNFLAAEDPAHLPYCNMWTVNFTFCGYRSYEEQWDHYCQAAKPWFVSVDGYPFSVVSEEEWQEETRKGNPCYFPRHHAKVHPHYYEMLDVVRQYGRRFNVPFWHCLLSRGDYSNQPHLAEGEMRLQVMVSLAYGVRGIQWFSYAHGSMLMEETTLEPTANWHIVQRLNRLVRTWEPTLRKLRSLGVYHYPHNLPYTRPLDMFFLGSKSDLVARGDACVVGQFVDDEGWEYALVVNRSPFEPALVKFHFGTDGDVLEGSPTTGAWGKPWPHNPREMRLQFEPGQGRLFRFKREIVIV